MTDPGVGFEHLSTTFDFPLISLANARMHPMVRARYVRSLRGCAMLKARSLKHPARAQPSVIAITVMRPRKYDSDNLIMACKPIRDGVADALAFDDGSDKTEWRYNYVTLKSLPRSMSRIFVVAAYIADLDL